MVCIEKCSICFHEDSHCQFRFSKILRKRVEGSRAAMFMPPYKFQTNNLCCMRSIVRTGFREKQWFCFIAKVLTIFSDASPSTVLASSPFMKSFNSRKSDRASGVAVLFVVIFCGLIVSVGVLLCQ